MTSLIYYSNVTGITHKLVQKLDMDTFRLPLNATEASTVLADEPFIILTSTYGGGKDKRNYVPQVVKKFLNVSSNANLLRGVIAAGSLNFREEFAMAGDVISKKFQVPYLYRFDLAGTPTDVRRIQEGLTQFWSDQETHYKKLAA